MNLNKSTLSVHDKSIRVSVPFSKVDAEKRNVHGFATLDNVDTQDDIVLASASKAAFSRFRGNIREMHDLKAVGRMVSFRPEKWYDQETGEVYDGIFVSTYVSKGAQDTWEKVVDGTLTGFSIGGHVTKSKVEFNETLGKVVRIIEDYEITELSLVDNPANQLANVLSFEKGATEGGFLSKTLIENIFFCKTHNVVQFSDSNIADCHQCGLPMANIGFVESDDPEKVSVTKAALARAKNEPVVGDMVEFAEGFGRLESTFTSGEVMLPDDDQVYEASRTAPISIIKFFAKNNDTIVETDHRIIKYLSLVTKMKEVEPVADEVTETPVATEEVVADEVVDTTEPADVEPEPTAETEQVQEEEKLTKADIAGLTSSLASIAKAMEQLPDLLKSVADNAKTAVTEADQAKEVAKAAEADLRKAQSENEELGKRLEAVESSTAFRKSADVGDIEQAVAPEVQSIWGGSFLNVPSNRNNENRR